MASRVLTGGSHTGGTGGSHTGGTGGSHTGGTGAGPEDSGAEDAGSVDGGKLADGASKSTDTLYVAVYGQDSVVEVDTGTGTVVRRFAVGKGPIILVETPPGAPVRKVYSINWGDNSLSGIDEVSGEVHTVKFDGVRPWVPYASPDGRFVYVGLGQPPISMGAGPNAIAVVSTADDTVQRTMDMGDMLPACLVVSPDGGTLYLAHIFTSVLWAVSAETGSVVKEPIAVGATPAWMSMTPDGSKLYTMNILGGDVTVVDTQSWSVETSVPTGFLSISLIATPTPNGDTLAVTNFGLFNAMLIDTETNQVTHTLDVDGRPVGVAFSADGKRGYLTSFGHSSIDLPPDLMQLLFAGNLDTSIPQGPGQIIAFDPATGAATGSPIELGRGPTSVVVAAP